jgi:hypothetical protein
MPIKFLIARGIGFSPGDVRYVPTHGLSIAAAAVGGGGGNVPCWMWFFEDWDVL